ncbi:phosphoribosyl-dephospho-CoA transferase [Edwardsiella hoshinae]|nr:malonate decarboxylase holo-ACP synthase [Edwardsiella hoshinae]AOV98548.1 phosphoribosyl-dephospho-CoA transferase [Edwardsiella hoshinae]QPR29813.1 malonate decarboxylase holo-ACP synthase [Edwardsiella hoshinae]
MAPLRPHDLVWLNRRDALEGVTAEWLDQHWTLDLPLVVRRDVDAQGRIPVGVRGVSREQRAAGWVKPAAITRVCTPLSLADVPRLLRSNFITQPTLQMALCLARQVWPWEWGITGSVGYALATGRPVIHVTSDLDLLIRAPRPLSGEVVARWCQQLATGPCRVDTQVETALGAFALNEWRRSEKVLLKTSYGPRLVRDPWGQEA